MHPTTGSRLCGFQANIIFEIQLKKRFKITGICRPVCLAMNGLRYMESPTEYVHELCHYAKVNLSSTYCQESPYSINLER